MIILNINNLSKRTISIAEFSRYRDIDPFPKYSAKSELIEYFDEREKGYYYYRNLDINNINNIRYKLKKIRDMIPIKNRSKGFMSRLK